MSHWFSCSPLRSQQDLALLFSAFLQRAVVTLNQTGEMWFLRTSPLFERPASEFSECTEEDQRLKTLFV